MVRTITATGFDGRSTNVGAAWPHAKRAVRTNGTAVVDKFRELRSGLDHGIKYPEGEIFVPRPKGITSVAALRLVQAGRLELDQSLVACLPELAGRQVLRRPTAELDDIVPARRAITLRHLLTNTSGYGIVIQASPLQQAIAANGTEAGPEPSANSSDEWLRRLTELPLAVQPGEGGAITIRLACSASSSRG